ncbi:MAG: hypothetical protein AAGI10_12860 [Pseudomonadota bacterium]
MTLTYELTQAHLEDFFRAMIGRSQRGSPFILKAMAFVDRALIVIGLTGLILSFFVASGVTLAISLGAVLVAVGYGLTGVLLQQRVGLRRQTRTFAERNAGLGSARVTLDEGGARVVAEGYDLRCDIQHFTGQTEGQETVTLHFRNADVVIPKDVLTASANDLPAVYGRPYDPWQAS